MVLFIILIVTFAVAQVVILNSYSTSGTKLTKLLHDIEVVGSENSRLTQKIASASALASIADRAQKYGFETIPSLSLASPIPLANSQSSSL